MNKNTVIILVSAVVLALAAGLVIGMYIPRGAGDVTSEDGSGTGDAAGKNESVTGDAASEGGSEDTSVIGLEEGPGKDTSSEGSDAKGIVLNYASGSSWQDGDITMYGIDWQIVNSSEGPVDGWELEIGIEGLARAEGWNGTFDIKGDKLTIKNADYNGSIAPGTAADLGCNLGVKASSLNVKYAKLNGTEC
nr:cellulose-binding domain-containing protein [Lachnospiraceae bacterium]